MVGVSVKAILSIACALLSMAALHGRQLSEVLETDTLRSHVVLNREDSSAAKPDTLELAAVQVWAGSWKKFAVGQRLLSFSKDDIREFEGLALAEFLQARTGLFLRQNGPDMLASLTMRGTSAGHNAVFWNGLPINSPSLGQTDFSVLPTGGFEEVEVHFGGGAALFGTDAIGGSLHLKTQPKFDQGHQARANSLVGSFGRWNWGAEYAFSNQRIATRSKAYRSSAQNDFPFRDLSKPGTPIVNQPHAQVNQWGFLQDFAWKVRGNQQIGSAFWWNETDRQIAPIMGSNTQDVQQDKSLRWAMDYTRFWANTSLHVKTGWVRDDQTFNIATRNLTDQLLGSADVDWSLASKLFFKSGIRHTHIIGKLSTYMARENRTEVYHASKYQPSERFSLSINFRQLLYDGNWAPFAPSMGFEWAFWKTESHGLTGLGSVSRAFKVPTLNDRFWVPGGNPDILPEESWSGEFGLAHRFSKNKTTLSQTFTRFRMSVDNWIIWLPKGNIWSPENIRAVENDGFEYHAHFEQILKRDWKFEFSGNYAWTRALQTAAATENDPGLGKQLPYTPVHKLQGLASISKGNLRIFANQQWVSERFVTTDNLSTVAPYYLLDLGLQSQWHWGPLAGQAGFQINNLLDTEYQIMRLRAMPGRNYQFNLSIAL